jgi:adenylate cyclase
VTQARRAGRGRAIDLFSSGEMIYREPAATVLVEALLRRGSHVDLEDAQAAIDRLAAVPTDPGFVLHRLPLLRGRLSAQIIFDC